jgi:hypothetical protein
VRIRLKSDFHDFYDHWFAGSWQEANLVFERYTRSGPSRPEMMELLAGQGMTVPRYGRVRELAKSLPGETELVVHLDELAHQAEGKIKCAVNEAVQSYPDFFGVEYIESGCAGGCTLRCVCIGQREFWMEYYNPRGWRSNAGDVSITMLAGSVRQEGLLPEFPLWAIDYVPAGGRLYAIDFNIAPRLEGTGLEDRITPWQAYREIASFLEEPRDDAA